VRRQEKSVSRAKDPEVRKRRTGKKKKREGAYERNGVSKKELPNQNTMLQKKKGNVGTNPKLGGEGFQKERRK